MKLILLQSNTTELPTGVVDRMLDTNPYNTAAYGLLVALLGFGLWYFIRRYVISMEAAKERAEQKYDKLSEEYTRLSTDSIGLVRTIEEKMRNFETTGGDVRDIKRIVEEFKTKIDSGNFCSK